MKRLFILSLVAVLGINSFYYTKSKAADIVKDTANTTNGTALGISGGVDPTDSLIKADLNKDMTIDIKDLVTAAQSYNKSDRTSDINGDLIVDIYDLTLISKNQGKSYEEQGHIQSGGDINFRQGPGTDQQLISKLSNGTQVTIIGKTDDWYNVLCNGITGYVAAQFVMPDRALKGFDCYGPLSLTQYQQFKTEGYSFVARYYSSVDKAKLLTKQEAQDAVNAGLQIVAIYQDYNNKAELFNYDYGVSQCTNAIQQAIAVGQPASSSGKPSTIYFAVEEASPGTIPLSQVEQYFRGIKDTMDKFQTEDSAQRRWDIGVYGDYDIVKYVKENVNSNIFVWQTSLGTGQLKYFWKYFNFNIYQNLHDIYDAGIKVDVNYSNDIGDIGGFTVN
jgi:uncharacterized protein YgiM (DUF1202 family)